MLLTAELSPAPENEILKNNTYVTFTTAVSHSVYSNLFYALDSVTEWVCKNKLRTYRTVYMFTGTTEHVDSFSFRHPLGSLGMTS